MDDKNKEVILVGQNSTIDHKAFVLDDEVDISIKKIKNGYEIFEYILTSPMPDLIIMDLLSDGINGLHFCYIVKKLLEIKKLKIILFSEHSHRNNIIKGIQSGAADYIIDPCSDVLFKDRVLYHLHESHMVGSKNDQLENDEVYDYPLWKYISSNKDGAIETFFIEKNYQDGRSEIKKLIRNLHKKNFDSVLLEDCALDEFDVVKKYSSGNLSRFIEPKSPIRQVETISSVDEKIDTEDVEKPSSTGFGEKRLEAYRTIEPKEISSLAAPSEKRDRIVHFNDLSNIAAENPNLKILLEIDREVSTNKNNRKCMRNVIKQISYFIETTRASIIVPSEDLQTGTVLVANDDLTLENLKIDLNKYPEVLKALKDGEIVFIEDVHESEILKGMSKDKLRDYSSIIVIPIRHKNKVIAVLSVRGKRGGKPIDFEDVAFCQIIANTTAKTVAGNIFLQKIMEKFIPSNRKEIKA